MQLDNIGSNLIANSRASLLNSSSARNLVSFKLLVEGNLLEQLLVSSSFLSSISSLVAEPLTALR